MLSAPDFEKKQIIFVFLSRGDKLSFKNDNIVVRDETEKIKHQSTCYRLFAVFIVGHITVTSGLLQRAEKFGFALVLLTHSMRVYGHFSSPAEGNVLLRKKQYDYCSIDIGRHLVCNKINNQIETLKKIRQKDERHISAIDCLREYADRLPKECNGFQELLGLEGISSRVYFNAVFSELDWTARRPRVKHDMLNCLLDIGYTYLFNLVESILNVYGFDLYCGVYHREFYQRKSLVCDLVEPFRPIIDWQIRKAYNLGQINEKDFTIVQGQYRLFGKKASPYINWMISAMLERKQEIFIYLQSYYRAFMKAKPIEEYPIFEI